jgi:hypothetical protein
MNIFTISKFRYPKYLEDTFSNYSFYYEHNKEYQSFFTEHITEDISYNVFSQINNNIIKKLCFALYVIYFKGGFYIDLNVIPGNELATFSIEDDKFYCVKSILNNNTLFLGIFGSSKGNKLVLEVINDLIELDKRNTDNISTSIYELLSQKQNNNIIYLIEKAIRSNCVSTLTENNINLFDHYYDPKVSYTVPYEIKKINHVKDVKIGITLLLFNDIKSFFSNGINQNSLFLCELLLNIGFDVYFIVEDPKLMDIHKDTLDDILYDKRFQYKKYSEILYSEFNVIITLSFSYGEMFILNYLKYMNTKHVGYFCGNTYIIETEKILYNQHKTRQNDEYDYTINGYSKYDQIWSIPQMSNINLDFWSILHRCKCLSVPFVWSQNAVTLFCKANKCKEEDLYYINKGPDKKIAIFEPNISIMKWALPSVLLCEAAYRKNKKIKHLYITNINSSNTIDFNIKQFNKFMKSLDIVKDKKCSIEGRYTTLPFMKTNADIVVSHQWGNPLNYLYFDLAWMGWPIIHNADLCKDVGYFYEDFNLIKGASILEDVIENHDKNAKEYLEKNRIAIERFLPTNEKLQNDYKNLIFNLFV